MTCKRIVTTIPPSFFPNTKQGNLQEEATDLINSKLLFGSGMYILIPKYMQIQKFYLFITFIAFITQIKDIQGRKIQKHWKEIIHTPTPKDS